MLVRPQLLAALAHRPFALLWAGQTLSRLGDHLYRVALAWWVLEATGSAAAMGTVLVFSSVPQLLFLLIGGVAVDRLPRTQVMLASDLLRGVVVGIVALIAYTKQLEVWHIYAASILFGFVSAFFHPAYSAMVPDVTPRELLPSANSLTSLSGQLVGIIGPALGAGIVAQSGTAAAWTLDAGSFGVSALCLLPLLGVVGKPEREPGQKSMGRDLREGARVVAASPWLWVTILVASVGNVTGGAVMAVGLPFLVQDHLRADVDVLGWLFSVQSVGAVAAALWLGRLRRIRHRGPAAHSGIVLVGVMMVALALPIGLVPSLGAALLVGVGYAVFGLIWTNTLQEMVPRAALGRVVSIDMLGSFVLLPIGYGLVGWAVDGVGITPTFLLGGALTAGLHGLALLHPAVRGVD